MGERFTGEYPADWKDIAYRAKNLAGWRCARCGHPHAPSQGYCLTIHHANGDKGDSRWWNLWVLCQRCHLQIQGKVDLARPWVFEHSRWVGVLMAGYYASRYLGIELTPDEVRARLEELLALESQAVIGRQPIPLGAPS